MTFAEKIRQLELRLNSIQQSVDKLEKIVYGLSTGTLESQSKRKKRIESHGHRSDTEPIDLPSGVGRSAGRKQ